MKHATHPYYGAMLVLLSSIFASSKAIMAKLAYVYHIDTASLIALRMAFALPFFIGVGGMWILDSYIHKKLAHKPRKH